MGFVIIECPDVRGCKLPFVKFNRHDASRGAVPSAPGEPPDDGIFGYEMIRCVSKEEG